ncbi:MAG: DNA-binding protein [Undibacterium umbellatum]|uniref:DNA-binding protein n=1 Tax=Undibacterium umbellatum TaxID=2762300 RepID=UPI003BB78173
MAKSLEQVKLEFHQTGMTIVRWAKENGYPTYLVQQVLSNRSKCRRGRSHEIAVLLNLKDGFIQRENHTSGGEP